MCSSDLEGKPEGLALDINQSRSIEGFETKVVGQTTGANGEGYEAIAGSDVVVITAGLPRKPGMSRMDLIEVNAGIVRGVAENIAKHAPNAVVIVVSNPLDEMTALTQLATGFPKARVIGQVSRQRLRSLANVPTVFEVLPNYPMGPSWFGLFGPAGTVAPAIQRLNAEANKALTDPQVIAKLDALGLLPGHKIGRAHV